MMAVFFATGFAASCFWGFVFCIADKRHAELTCFILAGLSLFGTIFSVVVS